MNRIFFNIITIMLNFLTEAMIAESYFRISTRPYFLLFILTQQIYITNKYFKSAYFYTIHIISIWILLQIREAIAKRYFVSLFAIEMAMILTLVFYQSLKLKSFSLLHK